MEASEATSQTQIGASRARRSHPRGFGSVQDSVRYAIYAATLGVSIAIWFLAIRAPLWLDETVSFYVIKGGFSKILARQGWPGVPAYPFLLWLWTKVVGTGEVLLRISSVLTMLGAVYLLYCSARKLFDRDVALIAAVVFCLHPVVVPESIDVRPYSFAALAITASILVLVNLRHNKSNWLAAVFGLSAALIVYFQFLFVVILPALAISFFAVKVGDRKTLWRQLAVAVGVFALAFLPVIPGLQYMFHTSGIHSFSAPPTLPELAQALAQKRALAVLAGALFIAAATWRLDLRRALEGWKVLLCGSLALVPILILYGVSKETSIHVFVQRYRLVAAPGVALCWAFVVSRIDSRTIRLLFCVALVAATAYDYYTTPSSRFHNYTWKYALQFAEKNASAGNVPVLISSDLPEADYMLMPVGSATKDSAIFPQLSYYQLSVPVVALPRTLNDQAIAAGAQFLREAAPRHERFLALAFVSSYETLDWLTNKAAGTYSVRQLGVFDGVKVMEFLPRTQPQSAR